MDETLEVNRGKLNKSAGRSTAYYVSFLILVISVVAAIEAGIYVAGAVDASYSSYEVGYLMSKHLSMGWIVFIASIAVFLVSLVIMTVNCGKKDSEGKIILSKYDKIFTDVVLLVMVAACILAVMSSVPMYYLFNVKLIEPDIVSDGTAWEERVYSYNWTLNALGPQWVLPSLGMLGTVICTIIAVYEYGVVVRKVKTNSFWRHFIIGKIAIYLDNMIKDNSSVFWKIMIFLIGGCLISASVLGVIPVLIAIFIIAPRQIKKYEKVRAGIKEIKDGNLDYKIPVYDHGELDRMAMDINAISEASSKAVENELKSQRMKTDLITNVSHDLKTPLTSMVSYIDLLEKEGLDSENAEDYLRIIDEKTKRLQKLTEDLFDAAKASSGSIPLNMEYIEMNYVVNQALAELEERISAAKLDIIFNQQAEDARVFADGRQLWRVMENLIVNATKYALEGSRVYIDICDTGNMMKLEMKNISRDPLNIEASELMQRFKRGDSSRTTEGSGLGLAISKDLVTLMGGKFDIFIDGDLFKACVMIPKTK